MGNCLVTKLKESVNNTSLIKVGELRLFCEQSDSATTLTNGIKIVLEVGKSVVLESVDGSACIAQVSNQSDGPLPSSYVTSVKLSNTSTSGVMEFYVVLKNTNCEVRVLKKYDINKIRIFNGSESIVKNWGIKDMSHLKNSSIVDGYCYGIKSQGTLSFEPNEETSLTNLTIGINRSPQQPSCVDIDTLPLNLTTLQLIHTESVGDIKNYFIADRNMVSDFKVNFTKVKGDIRDIITWLSSKAIYNKTIGLSSYITVGNLISHNEDVNLVSNDNGASYNVLRNNVVAATYTIATDTWTYPQ